MAAASMSESPDIGDFFVVVTPGFEDLTDREIHRFWPELETKLIRGGIEVRAPLAIGYRFNDCLKTPTRVLLRLADFGCRDFPKLFKKISNLPLENWIPNSARVEFTANSSGSWLKIKRRIEETCDDARRARLKAQAAPAPASGAPSHTVFVRLKDDVCTVSLDTTGDILHKRGLRPLSSEAPLRESIAAALLQWMHSTAPQASDVELVDPMTGGGTFLLEAALLDQRTDSRGFAYQGFARVPSEPTSEAPERAPFRRLIGFEQDAKVAAAARENLARETEAEIRLIEADFLNADPLAEDTKTRWLIANPPYGERLRIEGRISEYYERLLAACERVVRPSRACLIFPEKAKPARFRLPNGWRRADERRFLNGGLSVVAVLFEIERP